MYELKIRTVLSEIKGFYRQICVLCLTIKPPRIRGLLEKLNVLRVAKKFPTFMKPEEIGRAHV
jgi:hypothetical protein